MMTLQAIRTKYHGPTNTRGSRITATCAAGKCTIPYPCQLSGADCHLAAAQALCVKLDWDAASLQGGCLPDGTYAFIFTAYPAK